MEESPGEVDSKNIKSCTVVNAGQQLSMNYGVYREEQKMFKIVVLLKINQGRNFGSKSIFHLASIEIIIPSGITKNG